MKKLLLALTLTISTPALADNIESHVDSLIDAISFKIKIQEKCVDSLIDGINGMACKLANDHKSINKKLSELNTVYGVTRDNAKSKITNFDDVAKISSKYNSLKLDILELKFTLIEIRVKTLSKAIK